MTYEEKLRELAERNPAIVVMTAENRAPMRNLASSLGDRFVDVGIAEQTLVGPAAGLALRGRIPIVHAFSSFLTMRAFEFIRTDVGVGALPVKLFGAMAGFLSEANGPTH
jgi:transketolase